MKTKAKSVQVFEVRLWSKKYYNTTTPNKKDQNIYDGFVTDAKTKNKIFFNSAGGFLEAIEKLYEKEERR